MPNYGTIRLNSNCKYAYRELSANVITMITNHEVKMKYHKFFTN